jgi:hypothetical protein
MLKHLQTKDFCHWHFFFGYSHLFSVIPAQAGTPHFLKKFPISSTGYPDLDPITESILVYTLLSIVHSTVVPMTFDLMQKITPMFYIILLSIILCQM